MSNNCSLSTKDLSMLEDVLGQEAHACKVCEVYAGQFNDQQLSNFASQLALHHQQRYSGLMAFLNQH